MQLFAFVGALLVLTFMQARMAIPSNNFKNQLQMNRDTLNTLLNILHPFLLRQNTSLRDCISPEKLLILGLYHLAHGNSYLTIGATVTLV